MGWVQPGEQSRFRDLRQLLSKLIWFREIPEHSPTAFLSSLLPGSLQQSSLDRLTAFIAMVVSSSITSHTQHKYLLYVPGHCQGHDSVLPASLILRQSYISDLYIVFSFISCNTWTLAQRQFSFPLEGVNLPLFLAKGKTLSRQALQSSLLFTQQEGTKHLKNCLTVTKATSLQTQGLFLALPQIQCELGQILEPWLQLLLNKAVK